MSSVELPYTLDEIKAIENYKKLQKIAMQYGLRANDGYIKVRQRIIDNYSPNEPEAEILPVAAAGTRAPPQQSRQAKGKCSVNASELGTMLADVNEISFCITIGNYILQTNLLTPDQREELTVEIKNISVVKIQRIGELETCLGPNDKWKAKRKDEQGIELANDCIRKKIFNLEKAVGIFWSNTQSKFEGKIQQHTGNTVSWNGNPSDVVIIYNGEVDIMGVLKKDLWFGISLKSSFKEGDIGQYNGSVSKFIEGVLFGTNNADLDTIVKEQEALSHIMQNIVHSEFQKEFYDNWCQILLNLNYEDNKSLKDNLKKEWKTKVGTIKSKKSLFVDGEKTKGFLFNKCTRYILETLHKKFLKDKKKSVLHVYKASPIEKVQLSVSLDSLTYKKMVAAYLRKNHGEIGDKDSYTYAKASMLDKKPVVELPKIEPYFSEVRAGECQVYLTQTTNTTINISCEGAQKSFDMRIKFGGSVPSSFKIDGTNNLKVISQYTSGGAYKTNDNPYSLLNVHNYALLKELVDNYLQDEINKIIDSETDDYSKILTTNDIAVLYEVISNDMITPVGYDLATEMIKLIESINEVNLMLTRSHVRIVKDVINTRKDELLEGYFLNELMKPDGEPIYREENIADNTAIVPHLKMVDGELVPRSDEEINQEKNHIIEQRKIICEDKSMCNIMGGNKKSKRKTKMRKKNKKRRRTRKKNRTRKK